ncbi:hypothetical protein GQ42DRAFT_49064 [Ramicandelaber brevisporus]|nr:hypothetical protein GQ42DRAFT_49064 [Ramicandelaber brevisporus]
MLALLSQYTDDYSVRVVSGKARGLCQETGKTSLGLKGRSGMKEVKSYLLSILCDCGCGCASDHLPEFHQPSRTACVRCARQPGS